MKAQLSSKDSTSLSEMLVGSLGQMVGSGDIVYKVHVDYVLNLSHGGHWLDLPRVAAKVRILNKDEQVILTQGE